jgi:HD-GYP domain-containing protein (c-di-GMP phosphodiesterase class II)
VKKTILHMGLPKHAAMNMYWAVLPHDIGKMSMPIDIWDTETKPDAALKTFRRTHTSTGAEIVRAAALPDHPFKNLMLDIMLHHHEKMDGTGHFGTPGDQLSMPVRLTCIADSYDGWRVMRPHYGDRDTSVPGVLQRIREEKGAEFFDMDLVDLFEKMRMEEYNNAS